MLCTTMNKIKRIVIEIINLEFYFTGDKKIILLNNVITYFMDKTYYL